jgi:hypothetical protein
MTDLNRLLRDADPLAHEPELSTSTTRAMRQAIVSAEIRPRQIGWMPGPIVLALTIACAMTAGIGLSRLQKPQEVPIARQPTIERQVQFETPGGTRIIWFLKSD